MVRYDCLTLEEKEYYKNVASYGNEYVLRTLMQKMGVFQLDLNVFTCEDCFLSLKHELHMYAKVVTVRWEEVKAEEERRN